MCSFFQDCLLIPFLTWPQHASPYSWDIQGQAHRDYVRGTVYIDTEHPQLARGWLTKVHCELRFWNIGQVFPLTQVTGAIYSIHLTQNVSEVIFALWNLQKWSCCNSNTNCCCLVAQTFLTLWDLMDCSQPDSSVHRGQTPVQAGILEWVAISISWGSSQPRDRTLISCISRQILHSWATREAQ